MPITPPMSTPPAADSGAAADLAVILSTTPVDGVEDQAWRLMQVYESAERAYRGSATAGAPVAGGSASTNW